MKTPCLAEVLNIKKCIYMNLLFALCFELTPELPLTKIHQRHLTNENKECQSDDAK